METRTYNGYKLRLYTSIAELPADRYQAYNLGILTDLNIGSSVEDIDKHYLRIYEYAQREDVKAIMDEAQNMRQCMMLIVSKSNPKMHSFVSLIESIDGKPLGILDEETVTDVINKLSSEKGLTMKIIDEFLAFFKKKIQYEIEVILPEVAARMRNPTFYRKTLYQVEARLTQIAEGNDQTDVIEELDEWMYEETKPRQWWGPDGIEAEFIRMYETVRTAISARLNIDPAIMTTQQFLFAVESLDTKKKQE